MTLVGSDHGSTLQAHDALSGTRLWRRNLRAGLWNAPALRGNRLFLSPHDQSLLSLRVETGEFLWRQGPRFPEGSPRLPGVSGKPLSGFHCLPRLAPSAGGLPSTEPRRPGPA
ncbi:MAG: PQQ-binding-like beta-propeller repeat protein [Candidatus Xenobium sp.]|nr:PQQ-binding-like beta-propeller repeat protein [Burkholderiales bacterium]